jgi:hypothetical protein
MRANDIANFDSINKLLKDLPESLIFIIRASNMISTHNATLGGNTRNRLFYYTDLAMRYIIKL